MSKFLSETGLSHFWTKAKDFIKSKYVAKGDNIAIGTTTLKSGEMTMKDTVMDSQNKEMTFKTSLTEQGLTITNETSNTSSSVKPSGITSPKLVKTGGTSSQVLLANGEVATLNAANGIPKLDANGRIALSQLGNLDTTLFEVVSALPTTGIKKNRIYLVKSSAAGTQNIYTEYVYTGDVSATYDASKWEELGKYKSDVDLSEYSKKSETIISVWGTSPSKDGHPQFVCTKADGTNQYFTLNLADKDVAGAMSSSDKKALDTLTARYPLAISKFTASPSLVEVGVSADITFAWDFTNTDFHSVTAQSLTVDGATISIESSTKTYKKTALAGATTATTKTASLTINGSLAKDVTVTYHYPSYIGVVANGATINETTIKALTKSIEWGKGKTATLAQTNQKIVYAYPASYGDLTSIKDGNGFQGFAGYTKQTLTVGGQSYNVYVQNLPATSSSTYTFA